MKRFSFRLESVLGFRRQTEEAARRAFAEARRAAALQAAAVTEIAVQERRAKDDLRDAQRAPSVEPVLLMAHQRHIFGIGKRLLAAKSRHAELEAAAAKAREALVAASRDRKVLEKLRERRFDAWRTGALREEQKDLDEIALRGAVPHEGSLR